MAESGLAEAYSGLRRGMTGNVGSEEEPAVFGKGLFWVEANDLGDDLVSLESTGMVGIGRASLSLVVEKGEASVASLGVFSAEPLSIPPGTRIDGFDSETGGESAARVGSNADVQLTGTSQLPVAILGDVTPGPSHQVIATENVSISGTTTPAYVPAPFPPVEVPTVAMLPGVSHSSAVPLLISPGTTGVEFLRVGPAADVTVMGPSTLVIGELVLEERAEMHIDGGGGRVDLYVLRALDLASGSFLSTSSLDPSQFTIQVPGETANPIGLLGHGDFYGVLYAPQAQVIVSPDFEVFGSLVARELEFAGPMQLHFDRFLTEWAAEAVLPTIVSWRIVDLGASSTDFNRDPFRLLGLDPASLPLAGDAHADVWVELEYLDLAGRQESYEGWYEAFEWADVGTALYYATYVEPGGELLMETLGSDPEENLDPAEAALLALINQVPPLNSSELKDALIAAAPCSDKVLKAAIDRTPQPMEDSHLKDALLQNSPLSEAVLQSTLDRAVALDSSALKEVFLQNSPLSEVVLQSTLDRTDPVSSSELKDVLLQNSPLAPSILNQVNAGTTPLSASDRSAVLSAN